MYFVARILRRLVEVFTHHVLHQAGHSFEVSGAHLTSVGTLRDVLLTPAVVLQLRHASDEMEGGLVIADKLEHLAPGVILAPALGAGSGLHVLHRVDGPAELLLATQGTGNIPMLMNLQELCRDNIIERSLILNLKVLTKAVLITLGIPVIKYTTR